MIVTMDLFGQNLNSTNESTLKRLLQESDKNWHNDIPKAQKAARKAFHMLKNETNPKLKAETYRQYGISFYSDLKYDSAIYYYEKATKIAIENDLEIYKYLSTTTSAMEKTGRFMDAITMIDKRIDRVETSTIELFNLLMFKLSASISIGLTEKSDSIIQVAESLVQNIDSENSLRTLNKLKGRYYHLTAQYDKSDSIFYQLLEYYQNSNNQMDIAELNLLLAETAMEISQYNKSSDLLIKSQAIYDSLGYEFGQANIHLFKGILLSWMGNYNDASDYIFKSLEVFEKSKNRNAIMIAYYELGWIFHSMKMEERAKKYLNLSLNIARNINNIKYMGNVHNAYGSLYTDLEKYDSAILHFDSAILYSNKTLSLASMSAAKFNKAVVLEKLGENKEALNLYRFSYKVDEKLENTIGLIEGEWVLGEYFMKMNQYDSAQYYFNLGEKHAIDLDEKYFLLKIYEAQANLYTIKNMHKTASEYLLKALKTQQILSEENKTLELATLETTYDLKNKEKELALLNLQKKNNEQIIALNQKTIDSQRNTLIVLAIGIILLIILSYIIFRYLKVKTKTNLQLRELNNQIQEKQEEILAQSEELKEANDQVHELNQFLEKRVKERTLALEDALSELDHFFYRASHDFRGPLTTLMGLVGISKGYNLSEDASKLFNQVDLTVKKLDGMVKKLQAVSFLGDFENLKSPQTLEMEKEINQIADEVIKTKSIDGVKYNYDLRINSSVKSVLFYPVILQICLSNLIENSLVFNKSDKIEITIDAKVKDDHLILSVKDNGIGISEDIQEEVFHMFKRTSQTSTGNGLGLYLVKKATNKLNGEIQLKSDTRNGSTFTLIFPLTGIEPNSKRVSKKIHISEY
ncbi:tetratricopeptide repeat-containing sensor histidine kinase [Marivirga salinae]|uniref:histidine kinase n=1 Tax=Marivirga salinarum TaxID=3059078 RepID=A0AA51N8J9_9BACT|nr:tetratricopeptide repeat-containing sensor histidine kinase [Marivirga sp. BDSF4-3]WMN10806.1 tetratricopeptide repeat-containing sensor histidine kinase [Marivirga sp. BDSF4-3]